MRYLNKLIYINAFVIGFVIMAFEMLGSRYLNPYFGGSIFTWAALISVVMIALSIGYFLGGIIADKVPSSNLLGYTILFASIWLGLIPFFNKAVLDIVFATINDIRYGSLVGATVILLLPLTLLGTYSPFAIRLILSETGNSGTVSGRVYGVSTIGSVLGTLVTTFYLIPIIGTKMITFLLSGISIVVGLSFIICKLFETAYKNRQTQTVVCLLVAIVQLLFINIPTTTQASNLTVEHLKSLPFGLIEHVESEYNDIYITKKVGNIYSGNETIRMSFRRYGIGYTESVRDLDNELSLPEPYAQVMTVGLAYKTEPDDILMLGLGGGSTTRYIQYYYPDTKIKAVELDKSVIELAKKYFGVIDSDSYKIINNDARVFVRKDKTSYDIIMVDAFRGGYIPFHLLTKEFYKLLEQRMNDKSYLVINLHGGTKLFDSSIITLKSVFDSVDTFTSNNMGNVIVVAYKDTRMEDVSLDINAKKIQTAKGFYYDMRKLIKARKNIPVNNDSPVFTDDFAPANIYESIKNKNKARW